MASWVEWSRASRRAAASSVCCDSIAEILPAPLDRSSMRNHQLDRRKRPSELKMPFTARNIAPQITPRAANAAAGGPTVALESKDQQKEGNSAATPTHASADATIAATTAPIARSAGESGAIASGVSAPPRPAGTTKLSTIRVCISHAGDAVRGYSTNTRRQIKLDASRMKPAGKVQAS